MALLVWHDDFPGELFAFRCVVPGEEPHERVWLAEELATSGLHRLMQSNRVDRDVDGVVWLQLRGWVLVPEVPA